MATYYANQQPRNLMDLLAMQTNAPSVPVAPAQPPAAATVDTEGVLTPEQRQGLLEALLQPDPVGPAPVVEEQSAGKTLATSFADALSNIATIYSGTNVRTNSFNSYMNRLERQKAERAMYDERKQRSESDAKKRGANYLLSKDEQALLRKQQQEDKLELQRNVLEDRKAAREEREAADALARAQKIADAEAEAAREQKRAARDHAWDVELAKINGRQNDETNKNAKEQKKALSEAISMINDTAESVASLLQDGWLDANNVPQKAMTPPQIRTRVTRELNRLMLDPETRAAALAYYDKEVESQVEDLAKHSLNQSSSPYLGRGY